MGVAKQGWCHPPLHTTRLGAVRAPVRLAGLSGGHGCPKEGECARGEEGAYDGGSNEYLFQQREMHCVLHVHEISSILPCGKGNTNGKDIPMTFAEWLKTYTPFYPITDERILALAREDYAAAYEAGWTAGLDDGIEAVEEELSRQQDMPSEKETSQ